MQTGPREVPVQIAIWQCREMILLNESELWAWARTISERKRPGREGACGYLFAEVLYNKPLVRSSSKADQK
jgi:hypothetical protein